VVKICFEQLWLYNGNVFLDLKGLGDLWALLSFLIDTKKHLLLSIIKDHHLFAKVDTNVISRDGAIKSLTCYLSLSLRLSLFQRIFKSV